MTTEAGRVPQEEPLAYFMTWTTYGAWLPGDETRLGRRSRASSGPPTGRREQAARQTDDRNRP